MDTIWTLYGHYRHYMDTIDTIDTKEREMEELGKWGIELLWFFPLNEGKSAAVWKRLNNHVIKRDHFFPLDKKEYFKTTARWSKFCPAEHREPKHLHGENETRKWSGGSLWSVAIIQLLGFRSDESFWFSEKSNTESFKINPIEGFLQMSFTNPGPTGQISKGWLEGIGAGHKGGINNLNNTWDRTKWGWAKTSTIKTSWNKDFHKLFAKLSSSICRDGIKYPVGCTFHMFYIEYSSYRWAGHSYHMQQPLPSYTKMF